jgi:hypothetical protein
MRIHQYYTQEECHRALYLQSGLQVWKVWVKGNLPNMNTNQVAKPAEKQK